MRWGNLRPSVSRMPQFLPVGHTEAGVSGGHLGTYTLGYSWESRRQSEGRWAEAWPWDSTSPPDRSTQAPVPRGAHRPGRSRVWREGSLAGGGTASFPARTSQEQHGAQLAGSRIEHSVQVQAHRRQLWGVLSPRCRTLDAGRGSGRIWGQGRRQSASKTRRQS